MKPEGDTSGPAAPITLPAPPAEAVAYLGDQAALMQQYVAHLADTGTSHGLIGPREVPRLWERHILNCAVVAELLPTGSDVIDIGSGAGLPGLVVAICRPDVRMTLIEPLQRRVTWLDSVVADLRLSNVTVVRSRAEEQWGQLSAGTVMSRAVAPLDKLARWSLPLVRDGGQMVALKGSSAQEELDALGDAVAGWGIVSAEVLRCGQGVVQPPTIVTRLALGTRPEPGSLARPKVKVKRVAAGNGSAGRDGHTRKPLKRNSSRKNRKR